jgi:hypothetical protein
VYRRLEHDSGTTECFVLLLSSSGHARGFAYVDVDGEESANKCGSFVPRCMTQTQQ